MKGFIKDKLMDNKLKISMIILIILVFHKNIIILCNILWKFILGEIYITYQDIPQIFEITIGGIFSCLLYKVSKKQFILYQKTANNIKLKELIEERTIVISLIKEIDQLIQGYNECIEGNEVLVFRNKHDLIIQLLRNLEKNNCNNLISNEISQMKVDLKNIIKKYLQEKPVLSKGGMVCEFKLRYKKSMPNQISTKDKLISYKKCLDSLYNNLIDQNNKLKM